MRLNKNIRYKCKEAKGMVGKMCRIQMQYKCTSINSKIEKDV